VQNALARAVRKMRHQGLAAAFARLRQETLRRKNRSLVERVRDLESRQAESEREFGAQLPEVESQMLAVADLERRQTESESSLDQLGARFPEVESQMLALAGEVVREMELKRRLAIERTLRRAVGGMRLKLAGAAFAAWTAKTRLAARQVFLTRTSLTMFHYNMYGL
jgi:hypothetical protein